MLVLLQKKRLIEDGSMEGAKNTDPTGTQTPVVVNSNGEVANNPNSPSGSQAVTGVGGDKGRLNRRNSISLPNILEAMEPPEYEPQVSYVAFFSNKLC